MLEDKVAVVTGSTRGIGFAIAKKLLENKAKVVICGRCEDGIVKAIKQLKEGHEEYEVIGFWPTLHKPEEVKDMLTQVKKKFGKIDILVNNAGISSSTKLEDFTEEEYDNITNLNIKGVFVCSKEALPYLKETKGVIVNTSSMVSIYGQPAGVMYPASKFAVNGMTKSLARELAPMGIRVNAVAPGITETDMVKNLPKEMIEPLIKTIPLGRIGKPEDIANAVLFLASDMASYITGVVLSVDGAARS
ncbi:MAG: 3-oxoacyl-ACP reductase FabG [Bacilli bacterium]|nr:3-oxoacyl-ACP reductase FabG [Bacilli bacterium]